MLIALTRPVSPTIVECALTFQGRQTIDPDRARQQHADYEALLRDLGARVLPLPAEPALPDAVFVEDTAIVMDEVAITTHPRLPSRREEVESVAGVLEQFRPLHRLSAPAHLEGGDVIRIDHALYVGLSSRTNQHAITDLQAILGPLGYSVRGVPVECCLHLKTACTFIGHNTVLANPAWVDTAVFVGMDIVEVHPDEPEAGNALLLDDTLIMPDAFPRTRAALLERGFRVEVLDVSELQKAEAGVTCCSIVFEAEDRPGAHRG